MSIKRRLTKRYRVQASATTNTYVYCRIASRDALRQAQRREPGYFYLDMMAAVFAAFTVEGYLNDLGKLKVSDWAVLEKKLGPREKLLVLRQLLRLSVDESQRPYRTLGDMLRVRDALAHGKTVTVVSDLEVKNPNDEDAGWPEPDWKKLCRPATVTRMVEDAEAIVRDLHKQAGRSRDPFASPGHGGSGTSEVD